MWNQCRILFLLVLMAALVTACNSAPVSGVSAPPSHPVADKIEPPPLKVASRIRIAAVGDIMLGTDFPRDLLPPADASLLGPLSSFLRDADVAFGNLEGVLMDGGEPEKTCASPQHCYRFRSPSRFAGRLKAAGFDVLSLANNHARDFGEAGRQQTVAALDRVGIRHSGQIGDIASWRQQGLRLTLIAFAPFRGAHNPLDIEAAAKQVSELAASHDIVLVSMHMGGEGEEYQRVPFAAEFFHGEARGDVVAFAHAVVDAGADVVIGHGPHVPRAVELYHDRLIAYSLGNFCTYWGINVKGPNGLAPLLQADVDAEGRFLSGRIVSARQVRPQGPLFDPARAAAKRIAELTNLDFPETALVITPAGRLLRTTPLSVPPSAQTAWAADKAPMER
jgi:hypothetical protein